VNACGGFHHISQPRFLGVDITPLCFFFGTASERAHLFNDKFAKLPRGDL
jgi:hypothetical protein